MGALQRLSHAYKMHVLPAHQSAIVQHPEESNRIGTIEVPHYMNS